MGAASRDEPGDAERPTKAERASEREFVLTRTFAAPARRVFEAWTDPERLRRWWAPASSGATFVACETDVRVGGGYRFVFRHPASEQPMTFFGRYLEAVAPSRLVWTNEESDDDVVTTAAFEERDGATRLTLHELHPSKEALDRAVESQSVSGFAESFAQLDALLAAEGPTAEAK